MLKVSVGLQSQAGPESGTRCPGVSILPEANRKRECLRREGRKVFEHVV